MTDKPAGSARQSQTEEDYMAGKISSGEAFRQLKEQVQKEIASAKPSSRPPSRADGNGSR
jgi:hypothetical protein